MDDATDEADALAPGGSQPSTESTTTLRTILSNHTALVVTVLGVALYGAVILRIAEGQSEVAFEILRSLGAVNATAGLTMVVLPSVAGLAMVLLVFWRHFIPRRALLWALLPIAAALVPLFYVLFTVAVLLLEFVLRRRARRNPSTGGQASWSFPDAQDRRFMAILAMSILSPLVTSPNPWLPTEVVTTGDGESVLGYVLDPDANMVPILTRDDRNVIYVPSADVKSRTLCSLSPGLWFRATTLDAIGWIFTDDESAVADCDDLTDND